MADLIVPHAVFMSQCGYLHGLSTFLEDSVLDRLFCSPGIRNFHSDIWSLEGERSHPITVLKDPNMYHYCFVFDNPDKTTESGDGLIHYLTVLSVETMDDFSVKSAGFFRVRFDASPTCEEEKRFLVAKERTDLVEPFEPNMFSSILAVLVSEFIRHHWMLTNSLFVASECRRLGVNKGDAHDLLSVFTRRDSDDRMYVLEPGSTGWQLATDIDLKKYSRLYDAVQDFGKEPPEVVKEEAMEETMEAPDPQEYTGPAEKSSVEPPEFSMLQLTNLIEGPDPTKETYKLHVCDRQRHTVEKQKETFEFTISLEIEGHHVIAAMVWIDIMHIGAPYIYVKMFAGKNSDLLVTEGNCANEKYISGRDYTKIRDFIFDGIANVVKEVYK